MSIWQSSLKLQLGLVVGLSGWLLIAAPPSWSRDIQIPGSTSRQPAITSDALAQSNRAQVNSVRLETTAAGVSVVLETAAGKLALPNVLTQDKFSYTDIPNAVLALPDGKEFRVENPATGIASIAVTQVTPDYVRVLITGTEVAPTAQITTTDRGLTISSTPVEPTAQAGNEPEIEINVVGLRNQRGYKLPNATTATKTDTPIKDIPQSIQIVPPEVLADRKVRSVNESLETVSGVASGNRIYGGAPITSKIIRGFDQGFSGVVNFRDGFPDGDFYNVQTPDTIDRVEVLKGPSSVLFGAGEPGGIVNSVTKKPLSDPSRKVGFEVGSYGQYKPSIDFSGPLNADKSLLYRFIGSYQGSGDFQGFARNQQITIAPSIAWKVGDRTSLNAYYEYNKVSGDPVSGFSNLAILSDGSFTPRSLYLGYPSFSSLNVDSHKFGYTVKHDFNDDWQIRNNLAINLTRFEENLSSAFLIVDDLFLSTDIGISRAVYQRKNLSGQIDLQGKVKTGSILHQLLVGVDFNYNSTDGDRVFASTPLLDIRNPNYNIAAPIYSTRVPFTTFDFARRSYGVYFQDQVGIGDNIKILAGGRYDWISSDIKGNYRTAEEIVTVPTRNDGAFSPRVGLVYQPSKEVSLYASYTQSFSPLSGFGNTSLDESVSFKPTRGTQYEVGVKSDFLDGKLSATLAAYQLTKSNVRTPDPTNRLLSIQTGEQQSKGIELDVTGEILPGWNVTAAYALTDARVTSDNTFPVGNRLANVPNNQASLWTKYSLKEGNLKGLGFGLGLFYVGARQGDLFNSSTLRDYLRTDAAVYYQKDGFNAAINLRNLFNIDAPTFFTEPGDAQRTEPFAVSVSVGWEF